MKIHIGCGPVYLIGYVNIDCNPDFLIHNCPKEIIENNKTVLDKYYKYDFLFSLNKNFLTVADLNHDIQYPLPFQDNSVEEIVIYQVVEHFQQYNVGKLLQNMNRILITGGKILISVPDTKGLAKLLIDSNTEDLENLAIRYLYGTQKNIWSHHYCGYTNNSLKKLLGEYNFGNFKELSNINAYPTIHLEAIKL
ncbi:MAG: methyltransferase domain-containing protein [Patescibacteria group bacterium]|jgi:predicted SAM-dependent methyltransferase